MPSSPTWLADTLVDLSGVTAQAMPAGTLYVVATPIGNLADITLRALWILAQVEAIAAEDTRVTRTLLARYRIDTPVFAAHQHNERAAAAQIVARLQGGARIALVSDAGTPGISDPGAVIVRAVHAAGLPVVAVPGPSSVTAAISTAGLAADAICVRGFPPAAAKARSAWLSAAAAGGEAFVLLEAPHRLLATAAALAATLEPARRIVVGRELTKRFETLLVSTAAELPARLAAEPPRGEYVLVVDAAVRATGTTVLDATTRAWLAALADELPPARAAAVVARVTGIPRDVLYAALRGVEPAG